MELFSALIRIFIMGRDLRDRGRCAHPTADGLACGGTRLLHYERIPYMVTDDDDPEGYRLVCMFHLRDGYGLRMVDWSRAARA
jgi:hypothetical protein